MAQLGQLLAVLKPIKDTQIELEASEDPNFFMVGRKSLALLFTNKSLLEATGVGEQFVAAFKAKFCEYIDDPHLMLEWAVAAMLDP
jgi:hypothetical protein